VFEVLFSKPLVSKNHNPLMLPCFRFDYCRCVKQNTWSPKQFISPKCKKSRGPWALCCPLANGGFWATRVSHYSGNPL
jgi:hypothetical protein